jgi:iron-sulfur cluster repair protein YtfE (RIC family)
MKMIVENKSAKTDKKDNQFDYLLTDNFQEFALKISEIHSEKKKKKEHLKQVYENLQNEMKELENKARQLNEEFEQWKSSQVGEGKGGDK